MQFLLLSKLPRILLERFQRQFEHPQPFLGQLLLRSKLPLLHFGQSLPFLVPFLQQSMPSQRQFERPQLFLVQFQLRIEPLQPFLGQFLQQLERLLLFLGQFLQQLERLLLFLERLLLFLWQSRLRFVQYLHHGALSPPPAFASLSLPDRNKPIADIDLQKQHSVRLDMPNKVSCLYLY